MNDTAAVESTSTKRAPKEVNNITMADGTVRDFGKKGQLQADVSFGDSAITLQIHLVTGAQRTVEFLRSNPLSDLFIARGIKEYISNTVAGVYSDSEGLHPEDFELGIDTAISNINSGSIPVRERSASETKGLADLIFALAEARQGARTPEGEPMFSEEESSKEFVTKLIVGSTPEENKVRASRPAIKAIIDRLRAERAAAKAEKSAKVASSIVDDLA